jgi:glycerol-3-phosphate acyltransferase PlsY
LTEWLLIIGGFLLGALPFSVLIGRLALNKDITQYGDRNPGATNVIRAGSKTWGILAIMADIGKGALPVGLAATIYRIDGWALVAAAIAPILGHAFSPFLNFKGGKAVATSFGTWIGLILFHAVLIAPVMLIYWYYAVTLSGWSVMLAMASLGTWLVMTGARWELFAALALNVVVLAYKHREDLRHPLRLRVAPWFRPLFRGLHQRLSQKDAPPAS